MHGFQVTSTHIIATGVSGYSFNENGAGRTKNSFDLSQYRKLCYVIDSISQMGAYRGIFIYYDDGNLDASASSPNIPVGYNEIDISNLTKNAKIGVMSGISCETKYSKIWLEK